MEDPRAICASIVIAAVATRLFFAPRLSAGACACHCECASATGTLVLIASLAFGLGACVGVLALLAGGRRGRQLQEGLEEPTVAAAVPGPFVRRRPLVG